MDGRWSPSGWGAPSARWRAPVWPRRGRTIQLGLLTGLLATIGPDKGRRRTVRLAVGTGLMGGLTTHSTYILETAGLLGTDHRPLAFTYLFGSLAVGVSVAAAGLILGESAGRRLRREKNEGDQS